MVSFPWSRKPEYPPPELHSGMAVTTMEKVLKENDFVDVVDGAIVVTPKKAVEPQEDTGKKLSDPAFTELGTSSPSPFTGWLRREYNPEMLGQQGLRKFNEMKRSDSTIRGSLRLIKTPINAARWFVKPASSGKQDKAIADFISWNLFQGMTISWNQALKESLLMLDYGWYMFEEVFTNNHPQMPGKICLQKLAPRHPFDVIEWTYDSNGGPASVKMYNPVISPGGTIISTGQEITIPIAKLAVFTFDKEAGDMSGVSLLRSAYKPWYYKTQLEKIDAIQKERHGIGIPIITLPVGFDKQDKQLADQLGRNLRTNERAHVTLPPGWVLEFAKLQGQLTDALKSIEYHNTEIAKNILAAFMENRAGTADANEDLFLKSCREVAATVEDVFNFYVIPQLVNYNWSRVKEFPTLQARRIGEVVDWRTLSFALRNIIGAGIVVPDDPMEELLREEFDLPPIDESTRREVTISMGMNPQAAKLNPTEYQGAGDKAIAQANAQENKNLPNAPQAPAPPRVGPPRQTAPGPRKLPAPHAGRDRSGG